MTDDPFDTLGLTSDASPEDVRGARRQLAKAHHPDRGGDPAKMRALNDAAAAALRLLAEPERAPTGRPADASQPRPRREPTGRPADASQPRPRREPTGITSDVPSFTVEALPVDTFEALVIVASWLGDVLDDDPPYRLAVHLTDPLRSWCRLDLVPDAGATTVSITIGSIGGEPPVEIEVVRDVWVDGLNRLDWDEGGPHPPA